MPQNKRLNSFLPLQKSQRLNVTFPPPPTVNHRRFFMTGFCTANHNVLIVPPGPRRTFFWEHHSNPLFLMTTKKARRRFLLTSEGWADNLQYRLGAHRFRQQPVYKPKNRLGLLLPDPMHRGHQTGNRTNIAVRRPPTLLRCGAVSKTLTPVHVHHMTKLATVLASGLNQHDRFHLSTNFHHTKSVLHRHQIFFTSGGTLATQRLPKTQLHPFFSPNVVYERTTCRKPVFGWQNIVKNISALIQLVIRHKCSMRKTLTTQQFASGWWIPDSFPVQRSGSNSGASLPDWTVEIRLV